ncbi:hypothetical protein GQ53DRAFT_269354 [Thozetella sp. PMI_491]|nr:hypothetical protein GQ53DRAFT_269354 [Thozetella sp. PMI_491]
MVIEPCATSGPAGASVVRHLLMTNPPPQSLVPSWSSCAPLPLAPAWYMPAQVRFPGLAVSKGWSLAPGRSQPPAPQAVL